MLAGPRPVMSLSSSETIPASGVRKPVMTLKRVDFPEPFGPMSAKMRSEWTFSEQWFTATRFPNLFVTPETLSSRLSSLRSYPLRDARQTSDDASFDEEHDDDHRRAIEYHRIWAVCQQVERGE